MTQLAIRRDPAVISTLDLVEHTGLEWPILLQEAGAGKDLSGQCCHLQLITNIPLFGKEAQLWLGDEEITAERAYVGHCLRYPWFAAGMLMSFSRGMCAFRVDRNLAAFERKVLAGIMEHIDLLVDASNWFAWQSDTIRMFRDEHDPLLRVYPWTGLVYLHLKCSILRDAADALCEQECRKLATEFHGDIRAYCNQLRDAESERRMS